MSCFVAPGITSYQAQALVHNDIILRQPSLRAGMWECDSLPRPTHSALIVWIMELGWAARLTAAACEEVLDSRASTLHRDIAGRYRVTVQ